MSFNQIETAHIRTYSNTLQLLLQQRGSVLSSTCMEHTYHGKSAEIVEQVGIVEATEIVSRHADTELTETPHASRWMRPSDWGVADMVDKQDLLRILTDPKSAYAQAQQAGLGRRLDDIIVSAAFGNNFTGNDGGTTTSFAADGGTVLSSGSVGITVAKLRAGKKQLMQNFVDLDHEEIWCWISAAQHDDLLGQTQVVSADFNKPIFASNGRIHNFFGINFKVCERLTLNGSSERRCLMFAKSGMHRGMWNGISSEVDRMPGKWGNMQVMSTATFGAARSEGSKFVEIPCAEA